jgi:Meckel syndrome type 1 protein
MHAPLRDLSSVEVWEKSLARSRRRRVLAARGRREMARRKQASAAVSAAMVVSPSAAAFAAAGTGSGSSNVAAESAANRAIAPGAPSELLRSGSTGPDVVRVQSALGQTPDGVFGPRTDAAVRVFQGRNGLRVDGIVGPQTWRVLFGPNGASYDASTPKYQFKIQRASKAEEAQVRPALAGHGPVAKIVLRSAPAADAPAKPRGHRVSTPETTPAVDHSPPSSSNQTVTTPEVSSTPVSTSCGSSRIVAPVKNYVVTGDFGESRPGHTHSGIDLAVASGTPIVAAACGVVTQASAESGYGNMVCIRHSSTLTTCYAHMSRFASRVGQTVHQGQVIGYVGCTGNCTGPHVHFETRVNGRAVDPAPYLSGSRRVKATHSSSSTPAKARTASSNRAGTETGSASGPGGTSGGAAKGGSTAKPAAAGPGASTGGQAAPEPQAAPAEPAAQQAPAEPAPAPEPAAQQAPAEPAPAPEPAPVAPAPAPVQAAPAPAPAPVQQAPAPAPVQQAPAPAPAPTQAAPAPSPEPVQAAPAPESVQVAPAPAAPPAPVQQAPSPEPAASAPAQQAAPEPPAAQAPAEPAAPAAAQAPASAEPSAAAPAAAAGPAPAN